jgi:hypothetical protein
MSWVKVFVTMYHLRLHIGMQACCQRTSVFQLQVARLASEHIFKYKVAPKCSMV